MAKKSWLHYTKVGFHLFLIGLLAMFIVSLIFLPLNFAVASIFVTWVEIFAGFLVMGYFVVRWKEWLFLDEWL